MISIPGRFTQNLHRNQSIYDIHRFVCQFFFKLKAARSSFIVWEIYGEKKFTTPSLFVAVAAAECVCRNCSLLIRSVSCQFCLFLFYSTAIHLCVHTKTDAAVVVCDFARPKKKKS